MTDHDSNASLEREHWYQGIFCQHHFDAHHGGYEKVYQGFDAEAAAQSFADAGAQMVCYFAKGACGYSYYPTKIGVVHPGLDRDFTGEMTAALKKRGIRRVVYLYLAAERQLHRQHPDWVYGAVPADPAALGDQAQMCANSPYTEQIGIPQMKEILSLYDIDGFFIDIFFHQYWHAKCRCRFCRELFDREVGGPIPETDDHPRAFAYRKWLNRHMEARMDSVYRALRPLPPDLTIINNWAWMSQYPVTPPAYVRHLTFDTPVPHSGGLYSWSFSMEARYLSTLGKIRPQLTWSVMNTRMNTWGSYDLREPEALLQECAIPLAGCGRTYIGDIAFPSGNPDPAVMELCGQVNQRTRTLEPYLRNCRPVPEVAVLHSADSIWSRGPVTSGATWRHAPADYPVCGVHKALIEGHVQMSILNSEILPQVLDEYQALILADQRLLSDPECRAIRAFVGNGGALLATGETGTRDADNRPLNTFALADVLGVEYGEAQVEGIGYLRVASKISPYGIPAMDIPVGRTSLAIRTTTATSLLERVPACEGKTAPAATPRGPGVTLNTYGQGQAIYCVLPLFRTYFAEGTPVLRKLALWMLDQILPAESRTIVLENAPLNVEMFYNQRGRERFLHLINYAGDKRETGTPQVQDLPTIHGIRVQVRVESPPVRVTAVPDGKEMAFTYRDQRVAFDAEPLHIHSVYRIELKS
jgi:hypothetical protein